MSDASDPTATSAVPPTAPASQLHPEANADASRTAAPEDAPAAAAISPSAQGLQPVIPQQETTVAPAPQPVPTCTEEQSSIPRPEDVRVQQPSLEELRNRVKATLAQRKPAAAAAPKNVSATAPSSSSSSSESESESDSDSSSSSAAPGDFKSLAQRRAELAKLLAEAQDQGDSDSDSDDDTGGDVTGTFAAGAGDSDDEDDDGGRRGTGKTEGPVHALFQGPATKNELHDLPADGPEPVPLPAGIAPGDKIEDRGRLRYLGFLQSVIDDAVVVVRQDVVGGGGALPPPRPGSSYLPYGGKLATPGPHAEVYAAIDTGSILTLEDGTVVGAVFETFGSLHEPFYSILLPQEKPPRKSRPSAPKPFVEASKADDAATASAPAEAPDDSARDESDRTAKPHASGTNGEHVTCPTDEADEEAAQTAKPITATSEPASAPALADPSHTAVPAEEAPESLDTDAPPAVEAKPFRATDLPMGTKIYFDAQTCSIVETAALKLLPKGSDASNLHDEEVGEEEQEYSDDEAEQQARRARKAHKRPAASASREDKRPRTEREYTLPGSSAPYADQGYSRSAPGRGRGRGRGRGGRTPDPSYGHAPVPTGSYPVPPPMYTTPGYSGWAGPMYPVAPGQAMPAPYAQWAPYGPPSRPADWGRPLTPPTHGVAGYDPAAPAPNYQAAAPVYQPTASAYQTAAPEYQPTAPGYQSGAPSRPPGGT